MDDITRAGASSLRPQIDALLSLDEDAKMATFEAALAEQETDHDIIAPVRIRRPLPQNN